MKRVDALEVGNDNRKGVYIFKWSSWTDERALAEDDAERVRTGAQPRDPDTPITFLVLRDDHLMEPMSCN